MIDKTLAIIGNGFDLNHGLNTSFGAFYASLPPDLKKDWESYMGVYKRPKKTWHDFELIIGQITNIRLNEFFDTFQEEKTVEERNKDQELYNFEIEEINKLYKSIYYEFRKFINKQNQTKTVNNNNIEKYIKMDTPVISFNYTDLIKNYSKNIYYIHGSTAENFLVLGYSRRLEYDYIEPEAAVYDKRKFRDLLKYARFLMEEHEVDKNGLEEYIQEYQPHVLQSYTGKGGWNLEYPPEFEEKASKYLKENNGYTFSYETYSFLSDELKKEAKKYRLEQLSVELNDYLEKEIKPKIPLRNFSLLDSPFKHEEVERLLIMGHGLEADIELFEELFSEMVNLKEVILFVYNGESKEEILRKEAKIAELTNCEIKIEKY